MTLIFSASQALLAAKAGARYVSPFVGRLDDISTPGMELVADIIQIFDHYDYDCEVLAASLRDPMHVIEAAKMGADIGTMPMSVFTQLLKHPLTDSGLKRFLEDWEKVKAQMAAKAGRRPAMPIYEYACPGCGAALREAGAPLRRGGRLPHLRERRRREAALRLRGGHVVAGPGLRRVRRRGVRPGRRRLRARAPAAAGPAPSTKDGAAMLPLDDLRERTRRAEEGGGAERRERQHREGKLTARERVEMLLDEGTFEELDKLVEHRCLDFGMAEQKVPGDGVVSGYGRVDGRLVYVFAQDFTVFGGSLSETNARKICKVMDLAMKMGAPVVGLNDSGRRAHPGGRRLARRLRRHLPPQHARLRGGAADLRDHGALRGRRRLQPGHHRLQRDGEGHLLHVRDRPRRDQDRHPRGGDQGGAGRRHDPQRPLGGRPLRGRTTTAPASPSSGSCCPTSPRTTSRSPRSTGPRTRPTARTPRSTPSSPPSPRSPTTSSSLIQAVVDDRRFLEVHEHFAPNIVVGFARFAGPGVGIVANQPAVLAGCLDIDASVKAARFVRFCDAFNIPLVTFEDVPGFLPGTAQEFGGIIRHGAKLLYAFAEATVPKVTVITRKAYGGAYCVMASKHIRTDVNYAWPQAEIAVMGPEGAVNVLYRRELQAAADPDGAARGRRSRSSARSSRTPTWPRTAASWTRSSSRATRARKIVAGLEMARSKRDKNPPKKHGNIPL